MPFCRPAFQVLAPAMKGLCISMVTLWCQDAFKGAVIQRFTWPNKMSTCPDNEKHEWKLGVPCGPCVSLFHWVWRCCWKGERKPVSKSKKETPGKKTAFPPSRLFYSIRLRRGKRKRMTGCFYSSGWHVCRQNADSLTLVCRFTVAGLRLRLF